MVTKKWYRATDAIGRKWVVSREAYKTASVKYHEEFGNTII